MRQPEGSLRLADGTILTNSSCGFANKLVWCWIKGRSMADCFSLFSDVLKTREITCMYSSSGMKYSGFTDMLIIRKGLDPMGRETVDIQLGVPEGGTYSIEEITNEEE